MAVKVYLVRSGSPWLGIKVCMHGRYLGFEIGPEKGALNWTEPVQKAWDRISMWDWAQLGLFFATQVWNTMVLSLLHCFSHWGNK